MVHPVALIGIMVLGQQAAKITVLDGEPRQGQVIRLDDDELLILEGGAEQRIPLRQILEIRFPTDPPGEVPSIGLLLTDGSVISTDQVEVSLQKVRAQSPWYGEFEFDQQTLAGIRFQFAPASLDDDWSQLAKREREQDLLVLPKEVGDGLDFTPGLIESVSNGRVSCLLGNDAVDVPVESLYGILYSHSGATTGSRVAVGVNDLLMAQRIRVTETVVEVRTSAGIDLRIPRQFISSIDFSGDQILYLSDIEPSQYEFTPFLDRETEELLFRFRRNMTMDGTPLRLGDRKYTRGLWIHSKTRLRYRIGRDWRRFRAVMGIDYEMARRGRGSVGVRITGDGRTLLESFVGSQDAPQELDLDVSGIRDLEFIVDFGGDTGISDWLDLADARVIK